MDEEDKVSEAEESAATTETEEERKEQEETGETSEEAHHVGEFEELRALIEGIKADITRELMEIRETVKASQAISIGNGAIVRDDVSQESSDFIVTDEEPVDPRTRDYTL